MIPINRVKPYMRVILFDISGKFIFSYLFLSASSRSLFANTNENITSATLIVNAGNRSAKPLVRISPYMIAINPTDALTKNSENTINQFRELVANLQRYNS